MIIPRRTIPTLFANDIFGVQPMTAPTGAVFNLTTSNSKLHKFSNLLCSIFDALNESWDATFLTDEELHIPVIRLLRSVTGLENDTYKSHRKNIDQIVDVLVEELQQLLDYISDTYPEIAFDIEMRGISIVKDMK